MSRQDVSDRTADDPRFSTSRGSSGPSRTSSSIRDWSRWLFAAILLVALVLRFRGLITFPLEGDEMFTFFEARDLFDTALQPGIEARPLYYFLQHALFWLGPDRHPAMLRALPLAFGMAGIWATWKLGREVSGSTAGAVGALLAAVSPWHLYASGMARYWSLIYLLACVAFWRLLVARRTGSVRDYLLASAPIVAGLLTHPTFLFPFVGCAVGLHVVRTSEGWTWRWPDRSSLIGLWFPLAVAVAAGILLLKLTGTGDAVRNWGGRPLVAVARLLPALVQWMTPVVFVAGLLGAVVSLLNTSSGATAKQWGTLACLGIASTIVLLLVTSLVTNVYADYAMAALPLFFVSSGELISTGARRTDGRRLWLVGAAVAVLLAGVAPSTASHLSDGTRFDYRPAFNTVETQGPDAPVFIDPLVQIRWYAPSLDAREMDVDPSVFPDLPPEDSWLIVGVRRYGIPGDTSGAFRRWLSGRCELEGSWEGFRFDYRTYRVELHRCSAGS